MSEKKPEEKKSVSKPVLPLQQLPPPPPPPYPYPHQLPPYPIATPPYSAPIPQQPLPSPTQTPQQQILPQQTPPRLPSQQVQSSPRIEFEFAAKLGRFAKFLLIGIPLAVIGVVLSLVYMVIPHSTYGLYTPVFQAAVLIIVNILLALTIFLLYEVVRVLSSIKLKSTVLATPTQQGQTTERHVHQIPSSEKTSIIHPAPRILPQEKQQK